MSSYKPGDVASWEPIPWDLTDRSLMDAQETGFNERASKAISWQKLDWTRFPQEGIFGHDRNWFLAKEIQYVASCDGEDLVLIQNPWHGFPDPPEWGLASRASDARGERWQVWGQFSKLPPKWRGPA